MNSWKRCSKKVLFKFLTWAGKEVIFLIEFSLHPQLYLVYCPAKALQVTRVSDQQAFFAWKMFHLSNSCYKSIAHHMLTTSWLFKSYIGGETNWAAMKMSKTMAVPWQIVLQLWNLGREARDFFCNCKVFIQNAKSLDPHSILRYIEQLLVP